jgi:hypothetical protein
MKQIILFLSFIFLLLLGNKEEASRINLDSPLTSDLNQSIIDLHNDLGIPVDSTLLF